MRYLLVCVLLCLSLAGFSTHNRAGEITYRHISGLTYEFTLTTYVYTFSPADRPQLNIKWGDGTETMVNRLSQLDLPNQVTRNIYKAQHTFPGADEFTISMEDPNRNGNVKNIPNSINVPFYIETTLKISPFYHNNSSPILLYPPIDVGCVNVPFLHNPTAYDPDGDSLAYEIVPCLTQGGNLIAGYSNPQASSSFSIDPITGDLSWLNPVDVGEYNLAILISEYRNGQLLGTVLRDMQVLITICNNNPPEITQLADTCVEVGELLKFGVSAIDVDGDGVTLSATGGPLVLNNSPATFPVVTGTGFVADTFRWVPDCEHVRLQPYQVTFKAIDDGSPVNLVDLKSMFIRVVAPSPKNLTANPQGANIRLKWDQSQCLEAEGYDIYRHNGYINFLPDACETGVPAYTGYVKVGSTSAIDDTTFVDDNQGLGLIQGIDYCYMVVATFSDGAESYASLEACAQLVKDVPVITHVTIDSTDVTNGIVTVQWAKPTIIDTVAAQGPYKYMVYHSDEPGGANLVLIDSLNGLQDTTYTLKLQNTQDKTQWFSIGMINNTPGKRFDMGSSQLSSSVFVDIAPFDNQLEISWNEIVPWHNDTFVVYRQNGTGLFDSIGLTTTQSYVDSNLSNGATYCYKVKSIGRYSAIGFVDPIVNYSQENCGVPIDLEPPCSPQLVVYPDCRLIENRVVWNNPNESCADDVVGYVLYYKSNLDADFVEIYNTNNADDTEFLHTGEISIAGCYSVVAVDSFQNVSLPSAEYCVDIDSCDRYRLPNVITPNGDGYNDVFEPFPYDFVEKVNMTIYNRWGTVVFKTEDPDIQWDGTDFSTLKTCSDGVYFYVCEVFEWTLEGLKKREIHGSVTIIGIVHN